MARNFLETQKHDFLASHVRSRPERTLQIKEEFNYMLYYVLLQSSFRLRKMTKKKNEKRMRNRMKMNGKEKEI